MRLRYIEKQHTDYINIQIKRKRQIEGEERQADRPKYGENPGRRSIFIEATFKFEEFSFMMKAKANKYFDTKDD